MNLPLSSVNKPKIGTCPHGLPLGACPICNGMGGGGGAKKMERPAGEMSWDECYAVWQQMLKAKEFAQQKRELANAQLMAQANFSARIFNPAQSIANLAQKLANFIQKSNSMPAANFLTKVLVLASKVALPVLNLAKNVAEFVQKPINFIKEKLADISDKLNAIFGELKNSQEKKISDRFKDFKKKFKSLFGIFEPIDAENEEKQIEENKRIFELKNVLQQIREKLFNNPKGTINADD